MVLTVQTLRLWVSIPLAVWMFPRHSFSLRVSFVVLFYIEALHQLIFRPRRPVKCEKKVTVNSDTVESNGANPYR